MQVPANWPVYDLTTQPSRCVRFDQHAVYLGHQGANASCPARLLGKTEAVQVEPLDSQSRASLVGIATSELVNGQMAAVQPSSDATRSIVASFSQLGIVITITYSQNPTVAQDVLQSVRNR
jgi:hypothetical protein